MPTDFIIKWLKRLSLSAPRDKWPWDEKPQKRPWRLLQVESSLACNLRCIMCPWQQIASDAGPKGIMKQRVWMAIRPYLPQITSVDFTGGGEPLLQPHLADWIQEAHTVGCETGILTNGLLLEKSKSSELIVAGTDWICVSMDGATAEVYNKIRRGSDFQAVCRHISLLNKLRKRLKPKLMINFVLMKINYHQIKDMVRLAVELGVDQLNFKQCDVIRGKLGRDLGLFAAKSDKQIERLARDLQKARKMAAKRGLQTTAFDFTPQELAVCDQDPRNSMFIRHDGRVAPCINLAVGGATTFLGQSVTMPKVQYGRLPHQKLADIWNSNAARFYREIFESRTDAHQKVYVDGMIRATSNLHRLRQDAIDAMPKAPRGCSYCHYLYNI